MWKVLRRYQGESYNETPEANITYASGAKLATVVDDDDSTKVIDPFVVNQRTIAGHQCRPYTKPLDPMKLTAPYDRLIYSKMIEHTKHENVDMRRKALTYLLELYGFKGEHVVASLKDGALPALVKCLTDVDEEVRISACVALELIAAQPKGQEAILAGGFLKQFIAVVDDTSTEVVSEGLRLLWCTHMAFNEFACTAELIKLGCIEKYVEKGNSPSDEVACMALAALGKVFDVKEAFIAVLDASAMQTITKALDSRTDPMLLVEAAECAGKLAFYSAGKRAAVQCRTASALMPLLQHTNPAVRTSASGALVACTISEAGKLQAIDCGVVDCLIEALGSETERDVLVNEVKTLCNISEQPYARLQLHKLIPRLEEIAEIGSEHESLVASVQKALKMVQWQPGDPYE